MLRVLQVLGTTGLGGAESRVMDIYRHINRKEIQFDFLVTAGTKGYYEKEIESLGGRIYYLPAFRVYNIVKYRNACKAFFKARRGDYVAVHGHMTSTASIYLPIAKKAGVPLTIAHARSAGVDPGIKGTITRILRKKLYKKCDLMLSCSNEASQAVFGAKLVPDKNGKTKAVSDGKEVIFMPNAIDTKAFAFDEETRTEIRKKYNINDKFVVGHVGSFRYAKNHSRILDIFAKAKEQSSKPMVLMLLGEGELMAEMQEKVKELGIVDSVMFLGNINPVSPYYQAFDVLLFPSHYEGMPGTVVEAQAAGLPCLVSENITKQAKITEIVTYMSLDEPTQKWAETLLALGNRDRHRADKDMANTLYDVNEQVKYYSKLYSGENE